MKKPIRIVFEGIDGSGKTTQAKMLSDYLNKNGIKTLYRHIFDSKVGRLLRDIFINNTLSNISEILILCATRQAFLEELVYDENRYDVILIDRFFLSIFAMQGIDDKDIELINFIQNSICKEKIEDFIFYIDTSPNECNKRLRNRGYQDRIERKDIKFHEAVYKRYLDLLNSKRNIFIFNGNSDMKTIHQDIVKKTLKILNFG